MVSERSSEREAIGGALVLSSLPTGSVNSCACLEKLVELRHNLARLRRAAPHVQAKLNMGFILLPTTAGQYSLWQVVPLRSLIELHTQSNGSINAGQSLLGELEHVPDTRRSDRGYGF